MTQFQKRNLTAHVSVFDFFDIRHKAQNLQPSRQELKNTLTAPLQRDKILPPISLLGMTLNNLMVRLQYCWSSPSFSSLLGPFCHGVVAHDRVLSMDQTELFDF